MLKVKNLFVYSLLICFLTSNTAFSRDYNSGVVPLESSSNVIQADIKSERIPAGTTFQVRMETPVNSFNYFEGDTFRSSLLDDIRIGSLIILPAGTLLRGRLDYVKPAGRFSKGGELSLSFDHAVTPFGKQIPVSVKTTRAKNLTEEGVIADGGTYLKAVSSNFDKGARILGTTFDYMNELGKSFWKGIPVIVTAPAGAFIGAIGGFGYFAGKSLFIDTFKKGNDIKINPGDIIEVTLTEPLDVPTN